MLGRVRLTVLTRADGYFNDGITDLSGRLSLRKHIFRWARQRNIQESRNIGRREPGAGSLRWGKWRGGKTILEGSLGQLWQRKDRCALYKKQLAAKKCMMYLEICLEIKSLDPKHQIASDFKEKKQLKQRTNNPVDNIPNILALFHKSLLFSLRTPLSINEYASAYILPNHLKKRGCSSPRNTQYSLQTETNRGMQ